MLADRSAQGERLRALAQLARNGPAVAAQRQTLRQAFGATVRLPGGKIDAKGRLRPDLQPKSGILAPDPDAPA